MVPKSASLSTILLLTLCTTHPASAADPCDGFTWDVARERTLFAGSPQAATAADGIERAPAMTMERLYELTLVAQGKVHFAAAPGKSELHQDAYGGLVRFRVPKDGLYRVSLDQPIWVDAVAGGTIVPSKDFRGQRGCSAPHKVVEFALSANQDLLLQFSNAASAHVRMTITPSI
jgi:hypothetical protein